jgi:hypothetical protein
MWVGKMFSIIKREKQKYGKHRLYNILAVIKQRCYNKNNNNYKYYGERGIKVCNEWMKPNMFVEWCLENGWRRGVEIDRIDNDGDYCPENCRFVTHKENIHNQKLLQSNNKSGYRGVSYDCDRYKWISFIHINGKKRNLGRFNSPRLAALRYDVEAYLNDGRPRNFS